MSENQYNHKIINDPIHGPIGISKVEAEILKTPAFLRLRHLKQLGLSYLVFPGATHTRFAHSIGAMHIMSRIIDSLDARCELDKIESPLKNAEVKQKLRLAALLHDIGHYPLSHSTEHVFFRFANEADKSDEDFKSKPEKYPNELQAIADTKSVEPVNHEKFGYFAVTNRNDILGVFDEYDINPDDIGRIFTNRFEEIPLYSQLISSSLDCDRLDYLLRDSYYTGVPYGHIDLSYLISNLRYDKNANLFAVDYKGISCFEHYLISRYFLYNITFHKTVMALELMAKCLYYQMSKEEGNEAVGEYNKLKDRINEPWFIEFNNSYFWEMLKNWEPESKYFKTLKDHFLKRIPLKLLFEERQLIDSTKDASRQFVVLKKNAIHEPGKLKSIFSDRGVSSELLIQTSNQIKFEDQSRFIKHNEKEPEAKSRKLGKVYENFEFKDLIDVEHSVISPLSQQRLHIRRLYFFNIDGIEINREEIDKEIRHRFNLSNETK